MANLELTKVDELRNTWYYLVNDFLPVMNDCGSWMLAVGKYVFNQPPFIIDHEHNASFKTVEELVDYYNKSVAPHKVKLAKALLKFHAETKDAVEEKVEMVNNKLYLIEISMNDNPEYNEEKLLELSDDFLKSHKIYAVPVRHKKDKACWSDLLGFRLGYQQNLQFEFASVGLNHIDEIARYMATHRCIAVFPTDEGMRVIYAPFRKNKMQISGTDPRHTTCFISAGPTQHPYYYLANIEKDDMECLAKWIMDEV